MYMQYLPRYKYQIFRIFYFVFLKYATPAQAYVVPTYLYTRSFKGTGTWDKINLKVVLLAMVVKQIFTIPSIVFLHTYSNSKPYLIFG